MFFMFIFIGKDNSAPYILLTNTAIELITQSFQSLNLVLFNNIWSSKAIQCYERNHSHLHLQFTCYLDYHVFDK